MYIFVEKPFENCLKTVCTALNNKYIKIKYKLIINNTIKMYTFK